MSEENTQTQTTGNAEAERRAAAAEAENARLKQEEKRRLDDEAKRKREQDEGSLSEAKRLADEATRKAEQLEAQNKELRDRFIAQTNEKLAELPEEDRKRVEKYREKLSIRDFDELVTDELGKRQASGTGTPPPPAVGQVTRVQNRTADGRPLEAKTMEILDDLGIDPSAGRKSLAVESDGKSHRFVFPPRDLARFMRERALKPVLLTKENMDKLIGS